MIVMRPKKRNKFVVVPELNVDLQNAEKPKLLIHCTTKHTG